MMDIIFQPTRPNLGEYPPIPAKKIIPQWYKDLPSEVHAATAYDMVKTGDNTPFSIKRCVPVLDFLTTGYVLRSQSEILLSCNDNHNQHIWWYTNSPKEYPIVAFHPHQQCPINIKDSKKSYFKLSTGYRIITPSGYSCLFYQSPYFFEERFTMFPGIVDTDTYDNEVLFPGFIHEKKTDFMIEAGTPLMWVFPFKRADWESSIKQELHKPEKASFAAKSANYINDVYKRFFHSKKNFD
jgi:hypothetical protein